MPELLRRRDLDFLLYEVLDTQSLCARPLYADHSRDDFDAVLDAAVELAEGAFLPHARELDENEPTWDGERVHIHPDVAPACRAYGEAGFISGGFPVEDGGLGLPYTLATTWLGIFAVANISTASYVMLTMAAANLLNTFGSDAQKARYLPSMLEGRTFGTMALSEPHAGSSLADIKTTATPAGDGSYRLVGNKMWITGGDHDLSDNIVHFVLARLPDAPPGTRGISLFLVPKILDDGTRNDVRIAGLNHKMGYKGAVNTAFNLGDEGGAVGWLVGEPHQGLRCMFHMMNEARTAVGLEAAALGCAGFLHSLDYARERPQGRSLAQRDPSQPQVNIIEHADVRQMLLAQKAYSEGGLHLALYCARLVDDTRSLDDGREAQMLLDLLTPICKAWPSKYGPISNDLAIQVLGGAGYTRDYPVERLYRDNRLNPIHEGTNGIQAMDLLGRKVPMRSGEPLQILMARIQATLARAAEHDELSGISKWVERALGIVAQTTMELGQVAMGGDHERYLANASVYLEMAGHLVVGWLWLEAAVVATSALKAGAEGSEADYYQGKTMAASYFARWELPKCIRWSKLLSPVEPTPLNMKPEWF